MGGGEVFARTSAHNQERDVTTRGLIL
jgi:hypothetical protein